MTDYKKYVETNSTDIKKAIRAGLTPMQAFYSSKHGFLPFFGNEMAGTSIGNSINPSYSMSHMPGRWLNALLTAEDTLKIKIDEDCVRNLTKWAYISVEKAGIGLPAFLDPKTFEIQKHCDLHNLRETMHAFYALVRYRQDEHAMKLALEVMDTVDRYYDYEHCRFMEERFLEEKGGTIEENCPFPIAFGRYIGPLVKLFQCSGCEQALRQAVKLKNTCFQFILNEAGDYDPLLFGNHTHSTTSMISSLAQLGEALCDMDILGRVKNFMENGMKQISLDFGWCIEGNARKDLVGEINNTSDIMETCLILGNAGFPGYHARAERILRGHFLPSQLLDNHFIPERNDPDNEETYRLKEKSVGAFGFPCPWGHEYEPGSRISFNWDIVGGAVAGLCVAYKNIVTEHSGFLSINLLFDYTDDKIEIISPYDDGRHDRKMEIVVKKETNFVRIQLSDSFYIDRICVEGCEFLVDGTFLFLWNPRPRKSIKIDIPMKTVDKEYHFRGHDIYFRWVGESVTAAGSPGKRLCFFKELGS